MTRDHRDSTDIHMGAYVAATNPGAVGANKLWVERTGSAPYAIHVRKADNSAWESAGGGGGVDATAFHKGGDALGATLVFGSTDNKDLSFIAGGSEWSHFYWGTPMANSSWEVVIPTLFRNTLPTSGQMVNAQIDVNEAGGYSGPSSAFFGSTTLYTPTGTLDGLDAGVWGQARLAPGTALTGPLLSGVVGYVEHDGNGALGIAASFYAKPVVFGGGGGSIGKAIGFYAPAQSAGAENWSGYFEGALFAKGPANFGDTTDSPSYFPLGGSPLSTYVSTHDGVTNIVSVDGYAEAIAALAGGVEGLVGGASNSTPSGTTGYIVGVRGIAYGGSAGATTTEADGVVGVVENFGGTITEAACIRGRTQTSSSGTIHKAISIYGELQTVGVDNFSFYGEGDAYIGGHIGIVTNVDPHAIVRAEGSFGGSSDAMGVYAVPHITGPCTSNMWGVAGVIAVEHASGTVASPTGVFGTVANNGSGHVATAVGVRGGWINNNTGVIDVAVSVYAEAQDQATSNYSVYAEGDVNTDTVYKVNSVQVVGAQQAHVADVASADAPTQTAAYVQADVQAIATLCNELKTKLDAALAVLSTHGLMA